MKLTGYIAGSIFVASTTLVTGCASISSVHKADSDAKAAQATASEALSVARQAQQTADDAASRSTKTEETVTRSFKKSMYK